MKLLAISTSGPVPSAALLYHGRATLVQEAPGRTHSETLMPLVDGLLCRLGLEVKDIDLFAADTGPGSFTGVRIGVCAANAMAFGVKKPVIGVSALEALAYGKAQAGQLCAILDARNSNAYAALFGPRHMEPSAVVVPAFFDSLPAGTLFTGDIETFEREIRSRVKSPAFSEENLLLADAVAYAALEKYVHEGAEAGEIRPLYLRPSQAERLFEARKK